MAADQNTRTRRDHAASPDTQPATMINLGYVALRLGQGRLWPNQASPEGEAGLPGRGSVIATDCGCACNVLVRRASAHGSNPRFRQAS